MTGDSLDRAMIAHAARRGPVVVTDLSTPDRKPMVGTLIVWRPTARSTGTRGDTLTARTYSARVDHDGRARTYPLSRYHIEAQ